MEKNNQYVAIIHLSIDIHEIKPNGEIDGGLIKTEIPQKQLIKIQGETLDDIISNVKTFTNASRV